MIPMTLQRKAAFVDLGSGKVEVKEIPRPLRESFLGGRGIDMHLLYSLTETNLDINDPGNILVLGAGVLAGTPAPLAAGAIHIGGRLPLTGMAGSLILGGFFGAELRFAGFDYLVIRGRADGPIYLSVQDGKIEICDATPFWDSDSLEARDVIRDTLGEHNAQVLSVGKPGEDPSAPLELRIDAVHGQNASELGLLMKSKNLKAVAVRGTMPIEIEDPDNALRYLGELMALTPLPAAEGQSGRDIIQKIYEDECLQALTDSLGIIRCSVNLLSAELPQWEVYRLLLKAVTGLDYLPEELMRTGERIFNQEQLFNIREGFSWTQTGQLFNGHREIPGFSPLAGSAWELYCQVHGWDRQGRPTPEILERLGLDGMPDLFLLR
jgi:aldehyde:ferredoxin oxidoreductase